MTRRSARSVGLVGSLAVGFLLIGAACADDGGHDVSTTTREPAASTSTSRPPADTTTVPTTTVPPVLARRWVGTAWSPGSDGQASSVLVDGSQVGLTSVTALCQVEGCPYGLDLLTNAPTGAAPAPGPYLLWSSRLVGRRADGSPEWRVIDQRSLTLEPGTSPALCHRTGDAMATALGVIETAVALPGGSATPERVWTAATDGRLAEPDPTGFTCELGDE